MATEHIIRQALKYNKAFDVLLCAAAHDGLGGEKFESPEAWYKHLRHISREIKIQKVGNSFVATNNPLEKENEMIR